MIYNGVANRISDSDSSDCWHGLWCGEALQVPYKGVTMDLITVLVLGSYAFSAGSYIFTWKIYEQLSNHRRAELRLHLNDTCSDDCYYCENKP